VPWFQEETVQFEGKKAVVTGAAQGIGRAIASALAQGGAEVAVVDLDEERADRAASSLGARAYGCDVSSFEQCQEVGSRILSDLGEVDFLVNNAGIVRDRLFLRMTPEDWNSVLAVNLTGAFNFTKALAPSMLKRRRGSIVNIASVIGQMGNAGQANYAASKAGIIGLTKALAKEFAARGVRVNAVAPGFIDTDMTRALDEDIRERMKGLIPLGRFGTVEDVARVVLFLLSDAAAYVTGQVINCDGGMVMAR